MTPEFEVIGKSVPRLDGLEKVTGKAIYTTDIHLPNMLIGRAKRSPYPFARIRSVNTEKARKLPGVKAVITAKDVVQFPYGIVIDDELPLVDEYARYAGDEVAAVAAVDEETAEEALALIEVDYEELTPVLNMEKAMDPGAPVIHPELPQIKHNVSYHIEYERGEGEKAFKEVDLIVEDRFTTPLQQHSALEPQGCIAQWDVSGRLTAWAGTQRIFPNRDTLAKSLGIPGHHVRIIQPYIGGAFGCKIELQRVFPIAALLAKATGRPVKYIHTREDEMIAGRPRVPEVINLKLGFKKDGTMIAKSSRITGSSGAYAGWCSAMVSTSSVRPDCLYQQPNIKTVTNLVYTNTIPCGAFRGFGNPQMAFAMESLIDMAAQKLGIDPLEIRLKNAVEKGDTTVHGWNLKSCELKESLRQIAKASDWKNKKRKRNKNRGIGIACQVHVNGNKLVAKWYGYEGSAALIDVDRYGKIKVNSGESHMGQGSITVYGQIAAEAIGANMEDVYVNPYIDTDTSPFCLGIYATRGTTLGGNAVRMAALDVRKKLMKYASEKLRVSIHNLVLRNSKFYVKGSAQEAATLEEIANELIFTKQRGVPITGRGEYTVPPEVVLPDATGYGNYSISYTYSTAAAEVEVDPRMGKVKVINVWHAVDIGRVLNPKVTEGQLEGGVAQGIGYALIEDCIMRNGVIQNTNFTDYKIPHSEDTPNIYSIWVERPCAGNPYGAKGIGEPAVNPIAPAIANAIFDAVGVRLKDLPMKPAQIRKALWEKNEQEQK
ncbi:xanthine dehydrogenase family protein molybdopterin-binding subunit [Chloroflexota bacterium]